MGLADLIRKGVAIANTVTSGAQVDVTHEPWTGSDGQSKPVYGTAQLLPAIVVDSQRGFRDAVGEVVQSHTRISFLRPVPPNGAAGRREPIDPRDRLTTPDGTTGKIAGVGGMVDRGTGRPFFSEAWLSA